MNRSVIAVSILAALAVLGCAKAPIIKRTAPGYFMGFNTLQMGEARLLFYRGAKFVSDGTYLAVAVEDCKFEIGVNQFAVCKVSPGRADITILNGLDTVDVPAGGWECVTFNFGATRGHFETHDCRALMSKLGPQRQVWTTQLPRSEILMRENVGRGKRNRSRRGYPEGK